MTSLRLTLYSSFLYFIVLVIVQDLPLVSAQRRDRTRIPVQKYQSRQHPCEQSSCYPATGNLLIGRENRLYASSTCGLNGPERFCKVSHLEEKKCFLCDTRPETADDTLKNHRIGQVIYPFKPGTLYPTWWQSENGKEHVQIKLDLEAEFHFTHLIITFETFRPAAAIVERSYDFGRTWHIYRYFAHNCGEAFPGVPMELKNLTDVICDNRYSSVEPSKNGELIFRILPPRIKIENPYAEHIQNLLKLTNLRINFTRLHNLGDTLLDDRQEIQEKYYYAISNMVVRGSCSCYGHASHCLPLDRDTSSIPDMVHGKCECTHNTKGLNCEECEDFYNDLPWKPAFGRQTNACKKCNCNSHATSCHFDQAVYEHTGRVSGGVCDNCQHHTQGQHCEECIAFFYRDPNEDIQSPYVCKPCDCDPNGSVDEGICDSFSDPENNIEAGACHCKPNVKGRRCDTCKDGFWDLDARNPDGCRNCTCNILGTIDNSGCNMYTGECTCKRLVTGKDCNQCLPSTYGLSDDKDGCRPCACDPGGSLDDFCDVFSGQCRCRPHMSGRACNVPLQNYFIPSLHTVYEAEMPEITECVSYGPYGNCTIITYAQPGDRLPVWTGPGYRRVPENTELKFTVDHLPKTMSYDVIVRYSTESRGDWDDAYITVVRPSQYEHDGPCPNSHPIHESRIPFTLPQYDTKVVALHDICLEQDKKYQINIHFERRRHGEDNPSAQIFIDSLALVPRIEVTPLFTGSAPADNRRREYMENDCNRTYYDVHFEAAASPTCKDFYKTVSIFVHDGASSCSCDATGSLSKQCDPYGGFCQCKPNVIGRQCEKCAPGNYGFGPEGCKACDCNSIGSRGYECDLRTGQCDCLPNTYGRECDECQLGFWNFPDCQMCQCNGHAISCNPTSGQCIGCQDYTAGDNCDRCVEGYYGNPFLGSEIGCRPCRCPDTVASGHSHADVCELDRKTNDMVCYCKEGYSGPRCDICADNYFGNPEVPGGTCQRCNCSSNIDMRDAGNCDGKTGKCLKCLSDTTGDHCEICKDGFYGDALRQNCRPCRCEILGTNSTLQHCDRYTGQCPCLKNVQGVRCEECIPNHWKIASGVGCEPCDCDSVGSLREQCNPFDGQCDCRQGFGGRQCDQCQADFWGDPNIQCYPCNCDPHGSATAQCDRETGQCECNPGIGGFKCDMCDRGYIGKSPYCSPCGECFDNWDLILKDLEAETHAAIEKAKQIKTEGISGVYTTSFNSMEERLGLIKEYLDNTTVSMQDINELTKTVKELRTILNSAEQDLELSKDNIEDIRSNIIFSKIQLESSRNKSEEINALSKQFKENITQLQEKSIEGALNLTRKAFEEVLALDATQKEAQANTDNAERNCKRTESSIEKNQDEFSETTLSNDQAIEDYRRQLDNLTGIIPYLNDNVCDKAGNPCDSVCGGAGCGSCGGVSCEQGAKTKAEKALSIAKSTEEAIKAKKENADDMRRSLSQAKSKDAYDKSKEAFENAEHYLNRTKNLIKDGNELLGELTEIINNKTASPEEIRNLTQETLKLNLHLDPEEIKTLGYKINEAVKSLENVEAIISNTQYDLQRVEDLKTKANETKKQADDILLIATSVIKALDEADLAQKKAAEAIKQANSDINLTKQDLDKIETETKEAQLPANNTAEKVESLSFKLTQLKKNAAQNELDAKDIARQAVEAKDAANNAYELGSQLKNSYQLAHDSLNDKAKKSEAIREKAQQLLQRASTLTLDTESQMNELKSMIMAYNLKEQELESLQGLIIYLNSQMDEYLGYIQNKAENYTQCTA